MIIIDTREHHKESIYSRLTALGDECFVTGLKEYTDYILIGKERHAIQRKTLAEVMSQMKEIEVRMDELREDCNWLLVEEGDFRITAAGNMMRRQGKAFYETGMSIKAYYNFLNSLQKRGFYIKTTRHWNNSVWWMHSLHFYIQTEHYPKSQHKFTNKEEAIGVLMRIKGIGKAKANKIYDMFSTE